MASFGPPNWTIIKPKLLELNENNSDLYLDTLEPMNHEYSIRTSASNFYELCAQVAAMFDILATFFILKRGFHTMFII